jgi:translation elongation factor EF-Ts
VRPPTTTAVPPVPIQEAVAEFVGALIGMGVAAGKVTPPTLEPDGSHVIATYVDDLGRTAAVITADLPFAAATGAALAMIPAAAAAEAVKDGRLSETLLENYREVANMTTSLLNTPHTPHLKLVDVWPSDHPDLPAEVWEILAAPTKRREYAVTIDGYGSGHLGVAIR